MTFDAWKHALIARAGAIEECSTFRGDVHALHEATTIIRCVHDTLVSRGITHMTFDDIVIAYLDLLMETP